MLAFAHTALTYIVPFLLVFTLVVTVHEFGHFLVAKACGVAIDRFSIGFGRALLSWRDRSGVEWRLSWIPLGGYVRFAGDENAASVPDNTDLDVMRREIIAREGPGAVNKYLYFKPVWQRALVAVAGPVANFLLSTVLFAVLLSVFGEVVTPARVDAVVPGSAAALAGFKPGDMVLRANGKPIGGFSDLEQMVALRAGVPLRFTVRRGTDEFVLNATPKPAVVDDQMGGHQTIGRLGLEARPTASDVAVHRYDPISAIGAGAVRTWQVLDTTVYYLSRLVRGQMSADQLGGPIQIAQASHAIAQAGAEGAHNLGQQLMGSLVALASLAAVLSVSLGLMNLLPIPVLDGGHLLFYAYEAVARRPVGAAVQAASYRVGLALVLGLMLFATTNDLHRSGVFHFLGGLFS
jgi:regulator of sigma E protease